MIYGISFSDNLAEILVNHLLQEYADNPLDMAKVWIILPTKRACLKVKNTFLEKATNRNLLLPKLYPLYELEMLDSDIPPAVEKTERLLLLTKLCRAKPSIHTMDKALKMAISLGELLDLSYQFNLDLTKLDELVSFNQFATHWQQTVQFLDILHTHWPNILKERSKIDPMDRCVRQINQLTCKIKNNEIPNPIVLAGFEDVFPALTELIKAVSSQEKNLVFQDGFVPTHDSKIKPYRVKTTLQENAVIEALTKENWQAESVSKDSFKNVHLITAKTQTQEALTIALLLRKALEKPDQTAALVTTDRTLARQVISEMKRWNITLDDSAGTPLNHTPIGEYLLLIAQLGCDPSGQNYLSLLKHPLACDGMMPSELRQLVQKTEKTLREKNTAWHMDLHTDFTSWIKLFKNNFLTDFNTILNQHISLAETLAQSADKSAPERLWNDEAGTAAFQLLSDLKNMAYIVEKIEPDAYPEILKILMQQVSVRHKYGTHPRLDILGPIEARFHHADVCIIGGLNEGTFPAQPETGPWLNRPMRTQLGLPLPEVKIKELAMDFAHSCCSQEVYLTRAQKVDGAQTVPSRFLERLKAVAQINEIDFHETQAQLASLIDLPTEFDTPIRPAPKPPITDRPQKISVTQVETWRVNPYAIYARYILRLFPLPALENQPKHAIFGTLIHQVLHDFLDAHPYSTDKKELITMANNIFENSNLSNPDKALLRIKFEHIAAFIIEQQQYAHQIKKVYPEEKAFVDFQINNQSFRLEGTADRIDLMKDNTIRLVDYKTYQSSLLGTKSVKEGMAPQLALEALILKNGGIPALTDKPINTLTYWFLSNKEKESYVKNILTTEQEISDLLDTTKDGLYRIISAFQNPETAYEVYPSPQMTNKTQKDKYDDYAHLARRQEWTTDEEDSE